MYTGISNEKNNVGIPPIIIILILVTFFVVGVLVFPPAGKALHDREKLEAQEMKQAFEKQGCYMDDNLPVTKFSDWYMKNGWICEKK